MIPTERIKTEGEGFPVFRPEVVVDLGYSALSLAGAITSELTNQTVEIIGLVSDARTRAIDEVVLRGMTTASTIKRHVDQAMRAVGFVGPHPNN